jgi:DNA-binding transcriptional ArsR family regulator
MADEEDFLCCCNVIHEDIVRRAKEEAAPDATAADMAEFFKVFADATRLKIINALLISEMCVCDISALVGMNQSSISHHLKILRGARVIKSRRDGKVVYYSLCDAHIGTIFSQGLSHVTE